VARERNPVAAKPQPPKASSYLQHATTTLVDELAPEALDRWDRGQDIELRRSYANWLLRTLIAQVLFTNVVFVLYAHLGVDWRLTASVVNVWLIGTLAEVVGIVLVVTRYLFPNRDSAPT